MNNRNILFSQGFKMFFYIAGSMYIIYLAMLILRAYTELRSMPFFGKYFVLNIIAMK